jgi:hypothetical protein
MVFLQGSVNPIALEKNLIISEQLIKCICKINNINKKGSGFFCFIPYCNKSLPVLISAAHIISVKEDLKEISLEINDSLKIIELNEERKTFTDLYLDITIIEIIPEKDHIYDFLMLDDNLFKDYSIEMLKNESIYILHFDFNSKIISYGNIKQMSENNIYHSCNTQNLSGGAPIISVTSGKIIGLHIGTKQNFNLNLGTFLKIPITQFINSNKDYIYQKGLASNNYSINKNICSINNNNYNNNSISSNINQNDLEKIKVLEEKLKEVNDILHDRINKANSIININQKTIEELKEKLSRFPFEILKGEKLMSIIVISSDKKLHRAIICKNTELFCDLEKKIYQNNDKIDIGNYFTLNGKKIDETKSLDDNNIKDNDIIVLNNLKV